MKKILLFTMSAVCVSLLAGCTVPVATVTTNTLKMLPVEPVVRPMPLTAELNVLEQRATGLAEGMAVEQERLVREATAKALGQDPPSVDGPDVLIGMNVFTSRTDDFMRVTVTGYPASYKNFRLAEENESAWLNVVMPEDGTGDGMPPKAQGLFGLPTLGFPKQEDGAAKLKMPKMSPDGGKKNNKFYSASYALPLGLPGWGAIDAEIGWIYPNGMLFGFDANLGGISGIGLNLGGVYKFSAQQTHLAYGGGVGLWFSYEEKRVSDSYGYYYDDERLNVNFIAPFIRLRIKYFELSYRGLLGVYNENRKRGGYYDDDYDNSGFGWNNNQIMLGVYFGK